MAICTVNAQTYEIGVYGGGANVIGDVGRTNFILPSGAAFGAIFKWNKSKRYAWRASIIRGSFTADDNVSNLNSRRQRGFVVDNNVTEFFAGLEFNFVEYNLHKLGPAFTPYLSTGLTYFRFEFNAINALELQDLDQTDGNIAIPMIVGAKWRLNQSFIFGAEIGARYTFTDNLDASNPENSNFEVLRFGNIFSDDWYVFSGITFTYTFGRKPCQDCFE